MSFLLDTNVVSELRKGDRCHPKVATWAASVRPERLYISVLVLGEIRFGIERARRRDQAFAARLDAWFAETVTFFGDRILPVDHAIAGEWGQRGFAVMVPAVDGLMAATALFYSMTMVTNNIRDFVRTGVACIDPWQEQA